MEAKIQAAISDALKTIGVPEAPFVVEHPADVIHGDYASNVALVVAKSLGKAPRVVAEELVSQLTGTMSGVATVTIAGPGFINFHLDRSFFTNEIKRAVTAGEAWGRGTLLTGKRYIVEYTDSNPFKEFHVGHLFTNAVGESIARLCMMMGADVKRVCYQGDVGLHVAHAIWGMQQLGITPERSFTARDLGQAYAKGATAYKEDAVAKAAITALNTKIYERSDAAVNALYDKGRAVSLAYFETVYALVGTHFDEYFFESEAAPEGKRLVLDNPDIFVISDGARVFMGESYGLHTRVFLNNQGLPTYEAKELALAKLKDDRFGGYDHSIISTAKEINEYFKVLKYAMGFVYPELAGKTEHIGHGMVRLTTGKMSSRTGAVISALDFIAEVAQSARDRIAAAGVALPTEQLANQIAIGAIKYATLKGHIVQDSVFDKDKALSFDGDSGLYLQYTYARMRSLLDKAGSVGVVPDSAVVPDTIYPLEHLLYRFPSVVAEAEAERAPHHVTTFITEIASAFNSFYAQEKIADPADPYAPYKARITEAAAHTIKNGLWVLGITAPERM